MKVATAHLVVRALPLVALVVGAACDAANGPCAPTFPKVVLAPRTAAVSVGQVLRIRATEYAANCGGSPEVTHVPLAWSILDSTRILLTATSDSGATATGLTEGSTIIRASEAGNPILAGPPGEPPFAVPDSVRVSVLKP